MAELLRDIRVIALDCQASGATPAYGDLLELGFSTCSVADDAPLVLRGGWIVPRTERRVSRPVRELTGWTEACLQDAATEDVAWTALREEARRLAAEQGLAPVPTVIHYARFELPFLRDLHARLGNDEAFPFDVVCVHAIAARLLPDLPRRNIRALAGHLGHSPELMRRSAGHVEATAFIWRALVPLVEAAGVTTWSGLKAWLDETPAAARPKRRTFPLAPERRKSLPDGPGVYRFLRRNGDVLYVGKATSLKKRIAGHFKSSGPTTERGLELLTQVHDIHHERTESVLEAALLEADEIKRLDPPYNVQLRTGDRRAWFASRDLCSSASAPDARHRIGPLPSERALASLHAVITLAGGEPPTPSLRARALAVPTAFGPDEALFIAGWAAFGAEHLGQLDDAPARRILNASLALWIQRGHTEVDATADDTEPDVWDVARVRRRLERALVQGGLLVRRARILSLIADSHVAFQERGMRKARLISIAAAKVVERRDAGDVLAVSALPRGPHSALRERQVAFDAHGYDRLRVLVTELRRVHDDQGQVAVRVSGHTLTGERLSRWIRVV
jgi:DNA polymerase-3 subunit epsilon